MLAGKRGSTVMAVLPMLFLARHELLYGWLLILFISTVALFLAIAYFVVSKQKQDRRKRSIAVKARRTRRMCLVSYHKILDWLYSSTPEKYVEEIERIGFRSVNSRIRLFYIAALLTHTSLSYWSMNIFLIVAFIAGTLCIGRVIQRHFFKVLMLAASTGGLVWFSYQLIGYDATVATLINQPITPFILNRSASEVQVIAFFCLYFSGLSLFATVFLCGPMAIARLMLVHFISFAKSIAVRTGIFDRQLRKTDRRAYRGKSS